MKKKKSGFCSLAVWWDLLEIKTCIFEERKGPKMFEDMGRSVSVQF